MPKNMAQEFSGAPSPRGPRPENRAVTPHDDFIAAFDRAVAEGTLGSLVLSKRRQGAGDLDSVRLRPVVLRGEAMLSFVYRHATRDITRNLDPPAAREAVIALLDPAGTPSFAHATLHTGEAELQLRTSRKGKHSLVRKA